MGQVHPLSKAPSVDAPPASPAATVRSIDSAHCSLCGAKLTTGSIRHHVVSPQSCDATMTVCHTCHRATINEGYRPAE